MTDQTLGSATVTLNDVAREAGVSLATASRVLNGSTRKVADSYRERVREAADRLGYTANIAAQTTARGTSPTVALLVADIADPYFGIVASGVARGADEEGLIVTIAVTGRDPERETRLVRALRGQRPRGLILAASRSHDEDPVLRRELDALEGLGGRVVVFGATSGRNVTIDNEGGARMLGQHMAALGYLRAIALCAAEGIRTSDDRLTGFRDGFTANGGVIDRVYRGDFRRESGVALMNQALADGVSPGTMIFGMSDVIAIGAMTAARDAGLTIGADVAFCGFDDVPAAHDVSPGLTTVHIPLEELGYAAFRQIVSEDDVPVPHLEVIVRESTPEVA